MELRVGHDRDGHATGRLVYGGEKSEGVGFLRFAGWG